MSNNDPGITYEVELTAREMRAITKSLGITLDVTARKMDRCTPGSNRHRELADEWHAVNDALIDVSDVLAQTMTGGE